MGVKEDDTESTPVLEGEAPKVKLGENEISDDIVVEAVCEELEETLLLAAYQFALYGGIETDRNHPTAPTFTIVEKVRAFVLY